MKQNYFLKFAMLFVFAFISNLTLAQGTETFNNIDTSSGTSYTTRNWTGDGGIAWTSTNSRTSGATFVASGQAVGLNDDKGDTYLESGTITGGIGEITLTVKQIYSGSGSGSITIYIDNISVGTVPYDDNETGITTTISNINKTGDFNIKISNNIGGSNGGGNDRVAIDNVTWTSYSSINPTISFDAPSSTENETNADIITAGIPVTLTNYAANVTITPTVNASSTAEAADYTIDLTPLTFSTDGTLNIPLTIKDDADMDDETIIIDFTVTSGAADLGTSQHTVTIIDDETPPVPSIIITEVADPGDVYQGRFVEIYNNGETDIDLANEQVHIIFQSNGNTISSRALSGILKSNSIMIIGNSNNINTNYGFMADENYGTINGNGDDGYYLYFGGDNTTGTLLDAYGVLGEDGGGKDWDYEDSKAIRLNPKTIAPNATWTSSEWSITSADIADMTPGALENEFRFDGDWKPRDIASATTTDDVIILSNITLTANINVNSVVVESGNSLIASSPLVITATNGVTYNRDLSTDNWYLVSSPVIGETMSDMITKTNFETNSGNEVSFAAYDNSQSDVNDRWAYFANTATDALVDGKGYSTKLGASGTISYTGTFNASDVALALTQGTAAGGNDYNLLGNPYTSYVNTNTFLTAETANLVTETIWIWNQNLNTYETKVTSDSFKVAPGQAFFVEANTTNNVTFTEAMQSHEATDTFQRTDGKTELKILLSDGQTKRFAKIYYLNGSTLGFDNGFDGEMFKGIPSSFAVYSNLLSNNDGKKYQVQSLPNSNFETMIIPLGVKAESGKEITFSAETLNLPNELKVYLEDKLTNTFTRLDEANSEYKITLAESLDGINRFYLHTSQSVLSIDNNTILNSVNIYKTSAYTLKIAGLPQGKASISLFNVLGKKVMETISTTANNKELSLSKLATGIYFVKVQTERGTINKKIILE
jgi:hypothetical protein